MRLASTAILAGLIMAVGLAPLSASPPPDWLPPRPKTQADPAALREAMAREAAAQSARAKNVPGYQGVYLHAALLYHRAGESDRAVALLTEVIAAPENASFHIAALRMKAEFFALSDPKASRAALEECLRVWKAADPGWRDRLRSSLASFAPPLEDSYFVSNDIDKALEVNALLAYENCGVDNEDRLAALWRRVSLLERARRGPEALPILESLLKETPDSAGTPETAMQFRLKQVEWKYPDRLSPERLKAVRAIWADPALARVPSMIDVGYDLFNLERAQGHSQESFVTLRKTIDLIDARLGSAELAEEPKWVRDELVLKLRTYLVVIGNTYATDELYADAQWAWRRYEALAETDTDRESARVVLQSIERRMKAKAARDAGTPGKGQEPTK